MGQFAAGKFNHLNDWTGKFLLHAGGRFHRHSQLEHLLDFPGFDVKDGVQHLTDKAQFDLPDKTLNGFQSRIGVRDAQKTDPR